MAGSFPSFTKTYHHAPYPALSASAEGKVVVVTGGGTGIGKAIAANFAAAGAKAVIILGRTADVLEKTKKELGERHAGVAVLSYVADVLETAAIRHIFAETVARFRQIDVLVLNAGYLSEHVPLGVSDLDDYWRGFDVNVKGGLIVTQEFLRVAALGSWNPTLINISSGAAHIRYIPGYSGYAASKLALTRIMEHVHFDYPWLRVFSLQPGTIHTAMTAKAGSDVTPEDDVNLPAAVSVWLASERSEFLRGRMIWANWDVDELKAKEGAIAEKDLFRIDLKGWDQQF